MDVILLDTIPSLGDRGEMVKVKRGYARNFLFPRKLALPATDAYRRVFEEEQQVVSKRDELAMNTARGKAGKMTDASITIPVQVGEEDRLYGSVTSGDIAKFLSEQGYETDKKQVQLEEPIKKLGVYTVDIRLHREVNVPVKVWVVKE